MLISIYIMFQIIAIVSLISIYYSKSPIVSGFTMVSSGILMVGAWSLQYNRYVWDMATRSYVPELFSISTPYLATFNIIIFGLALMYFFNDVFDMVMSEKLGIAQEVKANLNNETTRQ